MITLAAVAVAGGAAGLLLARRLVPAWRGSPVVLAAIVSGLASLVAVSILVGIAGFLSAWVVAIGLALGAALLARFVPLPGDGPGGAPNHGPDAPGFQTAAAALTVALAVTAALTATWERIGTGMTGFDSTWYHGPIAAELIRTGETFALHFTSPQFLTWFYPHGSELIHSVAGSAWGGDLPSLVINLLLLAGCLVAAWVVARPWGGPAGPVSVAGAAAVLGCSVAFADQFGEARNDLAGTFFLLAGVALLANRRAAAPGAVRFALLVGLAAGLAAGTKLNFIPAAIVLLVAPAVIAGPGERGRALAAATGGAVVTGGFWYLRNFVQSGNPLPWTAGEGPLGITLPGPVQETGGREAGSVLDYALDLGVISDWFLPDLAEGFGPLWPLLALFALAGIAVALARPASPAIRIGGLVAAALVLAWLVGPTSASGPEGEPRGFLSGLRYLVPGIAIALALLGPLVAGRDPRLAWSTLAVLVAISVSGFLELSSWGRAEVVTLALAVLAAAAFVVLRGADRRPALPRGAAALVLGVGALVVVGIGYEVASRYDRDRYREPAFTVPGLDRAFAWSRESGEGALATNATRSYPFRGEGLDRRVDFPGVRTASGGLLPAAGCRSFREIVNRGRYRYLVLTLDREGKAWKYPRELRWVAGDPAARLVFRQAPTVVFELEGRLDPDGCR